MIEKEVKELDSIKLDLTEPKLNLDIKLKSLNVYVGQNGSGKTFILSMNYIVRLFLLIVKSTNTINKVILEKELTNILNKSYDPPISGKITLYNSKSLFSFEVDNNSVSNIILNDSGDTFEDYSTPVYLSSKTRLISNINGYLKISSKSKTEEELFNNCKDYLGLKYWDIMFYILFKLQIFGLNNNGVIKLHILNNINNISLIKDALSQENKGSKITDIKIENNNLIIQIDNKDYNPSGFGNGFQSLLTMVLSTEFTKHNRVLIK